MRYSPNPTNLSPTPDISLRDAFGDFGSILVVSEIDAEATAQSNMLNHTGHHPNHLRLFKSYYESVMKQAFGVHGFTGNKKISSANSMSDHILDSIDSYVDDYSDQLKIAKRQLSDDQDYFQSFPLMASVEEHIASCTQLNNQRDLRNQTQPRPENDVTRLRRSAIGVLDLLGYRDTTLHS